ncbi:MAG: hypothetical protein E7335_10000 [Clostridiales bacterium]|nr:hypothetical protein [Clostridiales bacterium]
MKDSVISFPTTASELSHMAAEAMQAGKVLDAIGYMRRAVELEPEDLAYRANLARLLTNSGFLAESMRMLSAGYAVLHSMPIPLMLLYLSVDSANNGLVLLPILQGAHELKLFVSQPSHACVQHAVRLMSAHSGGTRHPMRYKNILDRLRGDLLNGRYRRVIRSLEHPSRSEYEKLPLFVAIKSIALSLTGEHKRALDTLCTIGNGQIASVLQRVISGSADIYGEIITQLFSRASDFIALAAMLCAANTPAASKLWPVPSPQALDRFTHDHLILHLAAVTALNSGDTAAAMQLWQHILKLRPHDLVAENFLQRLHDGTLAGTPLSFEYCLTKEHSAELIDSVVSVVKSGGEELKSAWKSSAFRNALVCLIQIRNDIFAEIAPLFLSAFDRRERLELAAEYCFALGLNGPHTCAFLAGLDEETELSLCRELYTKGMPPLSMKNALSVRCAGTGASLTFGYSSDPVFRLLSREMSSHRGTNIRGGSAELLVRYMNLINSPSDDDRMARALAVSPRLVRYRRRVAERS